MASVEAHQGRTVRCAPVIEDVVRPRGPYRLQLMTYGRAVRDAAAGRRRAARPGSARRRRRCCARRTRSGSSCSASCSPSTPTRPSSAAASVTTRCSARRLRELHGLRPLRPPTVAQAVLRAICGQLIEARRARAIELAIIRACGEPAPTREAIGALSPAQLRRLGLATAPRLDARPALPHDRSRGPARPADRGGRGAAPARARPRAVVARSRRARRARQLPPRARRRSRARQALLGASRPLGRAAETAELLEPYGEWAGLAGAYLMAGWGRGLVPGASADRAHFVRSRAA